MNSKNDIRARVQQFVEERMQTTMVLNDINKPVLSLSKENTHSALPGWLGGFSISQAGCNFLAISTDGSNLLV